MRWSRFGQSSLKDIVPGNFGSIHLHMWRADLHGKGHGRIFSVWRQSIFTNDSS
jgi:hypothetical protein